MTRSLWIDVEDLFEYARGNPRPSGIQRLAFEIYATMHARPDVRFVRHDPVCNSFRSVPWSAVSDLFEGMTGTQQPETKSVAAVAAIRPHSPFRQAVRKLVHRLPTNLRRHVVDTILAQLRAFKEMANLADALWRGLIRLPGRRRRRLAGIQTGTVVSTDVSPDAGVLAEPIEAPHAEDAFLRLSGAGDVLLVLGSPWSHPDYADLVAAQRARGLSFALLVYDIIPLRRPEWCDRGLVRLFREWFASVFPLCDTVFAISKATAADVEAYARETGVVLPGPVLPIPIGTGFGEPVATALAPRSRRLPQPGTYALIVSTIEARKNHILLFRVWRRMLEEMPPDQVPYLVFAGRVGWLVDDLMRQIANTDHLNGKLLIIESPSDAELVALYQGCLFTMFPSFFEGWGLPVTESLAFGKPCLIADRTSLPEAGSGLCRSFDPDNLHDAYAAIRATIDDRPGLAAWEATIRRDFKPTPWTATVEAILAGLDRQPASVSLTSTGAG
jgi:glycosyltransferase involved in cell wall biosynthesis